MKISEMIIKVRKYGLKKTVKVLYKYKIPQLGCNILKIIFRIVPLQNIIVMESTNDFDMNSGALFQYFLNNNIDKKYKIVWFIKGKVDDSIPESVIQVPLFGNSIKREFYNNVAKWIIYDNSLVKRYREEQIVIYLGHATRIMKNCRGYITQPADITYSISSSSYNNQLMADIYGINVNKFVTTGMPVNDVLYSKWNELEKIKDVDFENKKVIIWMPTFRKSCNQNDRNDSNEITETGLSLINEFKLYEQLQDYLELKKVHLIIKMHPAQDMKRIKVKNRKNITILSADKLKSYNIDIYKLLTQTSALISDYSSISFDYLLLDKPIAYVLSDFEDYKLGFAMDNPMDYMPGKYLYCYNDFLKFIDDVLMKNDEYKLKREKLRDKVHIFQDGNSCERITKLLKL